MRFFPPRSPLFLVLALRSHLEGWQGSPHLPLCYHPSSPTPLPKLPRGCMARGANTAWPCVCPAGCPVGGPTWPRGPLILGFLSDTKSCFALRNGSMNASNRLLMSAKPKLSLKKLRFCMVYKMQKKVLPKSKDYWPRRAPQGHVVLALGSMHPPLNTTVCLFFSGMS